MATRPSPTPIELRLLDIYQRLERINNDVLSQIAESLEKNELEVHQREELALKLLPMIQNLKRLGDAVSLELKECKAVIFVEESSANTYIDMMKNAGKFLFKSKWKIGTAIAIAVFVVAPCAFINNMIFSGHSNQEPEKQYEIEHQIQYEIERRFLAAAPSQQTPNPKRKGALKKGTSYPVPEHTAMEKATEKEQIPKDEDIIKPIVKERLPIEDVEKNKRDDLGHDQEAERAELKKTMRAAQSRIDEKEARKTDLEHAKETVGKVFGKPPDEKVEQRIANAETRYAAGARESYSRSRWSAIEKACYEMMDFQVQQELHALLQEKARGTYMKQKLEGKKTSKQDRIDELISKACPKFKEELEKDRKMTEEERNRLQEERNSNEGIKKAVKSAAGWNRYWNDKERKELIDKAPKQESQKMSQSDPKDENKGTVTEAKPPKPKARFSENPHEDPVEEVHTLKISRTEEQQEVAKENAQKRNKNMGHWGQKESRPKKQSNPPPTPELSAPDSETFEAMPDEVMEDYIKKRLTPAENECFSNLARARKQEDFQEQEMIEKINELELLLNKKRQTDPDEDQFPKEDQSKIDVLYNVVCKRFKNPKVTRTSKLESHHIEETVPLPTSETPKHDKKGGH